MTIVKEKTFDRIWLGSKYLDRSGNPVWIKYHERVLVSEYFKGDNGVIYRVDGSSMGGDRYDLIECIEDRHNAKSALKISRITYPLKTSKKDKLVCKCDIESINDYTESVRNLEFGGDSTTYSRITSKYQCTRAAVVMIDDKPMCRIHGGAIALEYLLTNNEKEVS